MLTLCNLDLSYDNHTKALDGINLTIQDGECILFTGASGSGKSSIINAINGLAVKYSNAKLSGDVLIDDIQLKNLKLYEISLLIATVFQNPKTHFFNVNTTLELLFYLENIGLTRSVMNQRMEDMLRIFPIQHLLHRNIFELSGGEKQILCVAACYISGCKVIVLDEPSSNLDETYISVLKKMLHILKERGITLLIAEHRIYYLMEFVNRIFLIVDGQIKEQFSRTQFLGLSDTMIQGLGLRSKQITKLTVQQQPTGDDLLIHELFYSFGKKGYLKVQNISFCLGGIYGVVGHNGCGKSTFIRCFTGLERRAKDVIYFKGKRLSKKERLQQSALVMQDVNHQLFTYTVEEEIKLGVTSPCLTQMNEVIERLGLSKLRQRHPMSLSGGEKQRVAIASVACKNAQFIFFDEPTSGMDYTNMVKISNTIQSLRKKDIIIFIVSHDIEFLNMTVDATMDISDYRM